jgi:hypothetical protein
MKKDNLDSAIGAEQSAPEKEKNHTGGQANGVSKTNTNTCKDILTDSRAAVKQTTPDQTVTDDEAEYVRWLEATYGDTQVWEFRREESIREKRSKP